MSLFYYHDQGNSKKGKHLVGDLFTVSGGYHHGKEYDSVQTSMVLEKELKVLQPELQEAGRDQ